LNEDPLPSLIPRRKHDAIVVRISAVYTRADCREERIWENLLVRLLSAACRRIVDNHLRLVLIDKRSELVTGRSLVVHLNRKIAAAPPLDAEIVLVDVGASDIRIFRVKRKQPACRRTRTLFAEVRDQRHVLIEPDSPREFSRLRHTCGLVRG